MSHLVRGRDSERRQVSEKGGERRSKRSSAMRSDEIVDLVEYADPHQDARLRNSSRRSGERRISGVLVDDRHERHRKTIIDR
jgi:hypothetical protein